MNNKFGTSGRYRESREPWRRTEGDRALRSPDQEFETSGNYREPPDDYAERAAGARGSYAGPPAEERGGFRGRGPKGYFRTDDRIREDVCERLSWSDEVDATEIDVRVDNGDVILEGVVESRHMKRLAEDLAVRVPGVIDVHNGIRIRRESGEKRARSAGEAEAAADRPKPAGPPYVTG